MKAEMGDKFISESLNEYFDAKDDDEEEGFNENFKKGQEEEYFPVQSLMIENEWISPEERQKQQQELMNEDSPYFGNAKINSEERVRFISPILQPEKAESPKNSPKINRSILNELLPTQIQLDTGENFGDDGECSMLMNDKIYGHVFKGCFVIWLLASLLLINSKPGLVISDNITGIIGWFSCCLVLGLAMTAIWARVLAEQTEAVVYGLMFAVPAGFALLAIFSFSRLYVLSGSVLMLFSAVISAAIYFNRRRLRTTVDIVHSAAIFIQATPKVYGLVIKIVSGYVLFLFIWLSAFMRLFTNSSWTLMFFEQFVFVLMLVWFGAVLSTVQKFLIATWVRDWMNQTEDSDGKEAEKLMDEKSFGTICLAAGLLALAKMTRLVGKGTQVTVKTITRFAPGSGIIAEFFNWILTLISAAERFMQRFTDFVVYYLAVTETEGFINSCRGLSNAVDGHLGLALTTDTTAQLLLSFSTVLISLTSTAVILFVAKTRINHYSSVLIGLLSASVMDFVSNTYTSAIDATFLCYVMDLKKTDRVIDKKIHESFSAKLSSV